MLIKRSRKGTIIKTISLSPELDEWLNKQTNVSDYIRNLIKEDMVRRSLEPREGEEEVPHLTDAEESFYQALMIYFEKHPPFFPLEPAPFSHVYDILQDKIDFWRKLKIDVSDTLYLLDQVKKDKDLWNKVYQRCRAWDQHQCTP